MLSKSLFDSNILKACILLESAILSPTQVSKVMRPRSRRGLLCDLYSIVKAEDCALPTSLYSHVVDLSSKTRRSLSKWANMTQMKSCFDSLEIILEAMKNPCERIDIWFVSHAKKPC